MILPLANDQRGTIIVQELLVAEVVLAFYKRIDDGLAAGRGTFQNTVNEFVHTDHLPGGIAGFGKPIGEHHQVIT